LNRKTRARAASFALPVLACACWFQAGAQTSPSSVSSLFNPYNGSVRVAPASPEPRRLTLDDALRLGLQSNLGLIYAREQQQQQQATRAQLLSVISPNIDIQGSRALNQYNLEAEGFRPSLLSSFSSILGPSASGTTTVFPFVVKVNSTQGQANFSQYLFNLSGFNLYFAFKHAEKAAMLNANSARGQVVLTVGTAYLQAVADQAQVDYARSLLKTDEAVLYQTVEQHKAGVAANLDELRARVQYQTQQQTVINAENSLAKAVITLNRAIGLAPEQLVQLTDTAPYPDLETMTPEEADRRAMVARQDYQSLLEQLRTAELERKAAVHQRLPSVIFNGDYGVQGTNGGVYHDVWAATGTVTIPVFQEAKIRGDTQTAEYQVRNVRAQLGNLRTEIDQQVRDSMIDLNAAAVLVKESRSNVELATTALQQASDRFQAGVEDNLPATQAQSTLAQAQQQYVNAVFQYNQAKLGFARNLGMIDTGYAPEVPGGTPAAVKTDRGAEQYLGGR
jgi:outer membrane protein TolC